MNNINKDFKKIKTAVAAIAKASSVDYKVSTELKNGKELLSFGFGIWIKNTYFYFTYEPNLQKIVLITSFLASSIHVSVDAAIAMLWHFHEN